MCNQMQQNKQNSSTFLRDICNLLFWRILGMPGMQTQQILHDSTKAFMLLWRRRVVVTTTAQLHSTKPELRFCAGSNPACGVLEICDGEDL